MLSAMISPISLAAFSASAATSPLARSSASSATGSTSGVQRTRVQAASPSGYNADAAQGAAHPPPDRTLPRGSLLNLQSDGSPGPDRIPGRSF